VGVEVGVFGASGYTGRELVRLLAAHPRTRVAFATASGHAGPGGGVERPAAA